MAASVPPDLKAALTIVQKAADRAYKAFHREHQLAEKAGQTKRAAAARNEWLVAKKIKIGLSRIKADYAAWCLDKNTQTGAAELITTIMRKEAAFKGKLRMQAAVRRKERAGRKATA